MPYPAYVTQLANNYICPYFWLCSIGGCKISKQNTGNAGEYYLASILSAKDFVVTITLGRNEKYDLLVVDPKGKTIKISVKTLNSQKANGFPLKVKDESISREDFFYGFVRLNEFKKEPDFWIVPSNIVSKVITDAHKLWLDTLNKVGEAHKDSPFRLFEVKNGQYYPLDWESELEKYYKNITILEGV